MFGFGKLSHKLPPGGYEWTGSDPLIDACPKCGRYSEIKMDERGNWMCTGCFQVRTGQKRD